MESSLGYVDQSGRISAGNPTKKCWTNGSVSVSIPLLQKTWAPLLPCLRCCALYWSQNEDLHKWTQSTNQTTFLLPVQAKVSVEPKVCRHLGPFGVSLQKRFSILLILHNVYAKATKTDCERMGCGIDIMEKELDSGKSDAFENHMNNLGHLAPCQRRYWLFKIPYPYKAGE